MVFIYLLWLEAVDEDSRLFVYTKLRSNTHMTKIYKHKVAYILTWSQDLVFNTLISRLVCSHWIEKFNFFEYKGFFSGAI